MKMNLRTLKDTRPWGWPKGTEKTLLDIFGMTGVWSPISF
jgi:hypothetical protein